MCSLWLCIGICSIVWILNGIYLVQSLREKISSEFFMHIGLAIFFSVLVMELTLGNDGAWKRFNIIWLQVIGWVLYLPSAFLVIGSIITLKHRGKSRGSDFTQTTRFINRGLYGYVRQPMTLGLAIWSVAFIFVFQSIPSSVLCIVSLFCFWMAARKESSYNIRKFGDDYKEYMKKVPMWNLLRKWTKSG